MYAVLLYFQQDRIMVYLHFFYTFIGDWDKYRYKRFIISIPFFLAILNVCPVPLRLSFSL